MDGVRFKSGFPVFSLIYLVIGIVFLAMLVGFGFTLFHVGLLGVLYLIAFYGLSRRERWATHLTLWLSVAGLAFGLATTCAIFRLPTLNLGGTVLILAMVLYTVFSAFSLVYLSVTRSRDTKQASPKPAGRTQT